MGKSNFHLYISNERLAHFLFKIKHEKRNTNKSGDEAILLWTIDITWFKDFPLFYETTKN